MDTLYNIIMHLQRFSKSERLGILLVKCVQLELHLGSYIQHGNGLTPYIRALSNAAISTQVHQPNFPIATQNVLRNFPNQHQNLRAPLQLILTMVSGAFFATKGH